MESLDDRYIGLCGWAAVRPDTMDYGTDGQWMDILRLEHRRCMHLRLDHPGSHSDANRRHSDADHGAFDSHRDHDTDIHCNAIPHAFPDTNPNVHQNAHPDTDLYKNAVSNTLPDTDSNSDNPALPHPHTNIDSDTVSFHGNTDQDRDSDCHPVTNRNTDSDKHVFTFPADPDRNTDPGSRRDCFRPDPDGGDRKPPAADSTQIRQVTKTRSLHGT